VSTVRKQQWLCLNARSLLYRNQSRNQICAQAKGCQWLFRQPHRLGYGQAWTMKRLCHPLEMMAQARVLFAGQHAQFVKNLYGPRMLRVMSGVLYQAVANDCEMPPSSPCSKCCKAWCKERGERSRTDPHFMEYFYTKVYIIIIMGHYYKQMRERFLSRTPWFRVSDS